MSLLWDGYSIIMGPMQPIPRLLSLERLRIGWSCPPATGLYITWVHTSSTPPSTFGSSSLQQQNPITEHYLDPVELVHATIFPRNSLPYFALTVALCATLESTHEARTINWYLSEVAIWVRCWSSYSRITNRDGAPPPPIMRLYAILGIPL
jgi:hypothetical protein